MAEETGETEGLLEEEVVPAEGIGEVVIGEREETGVEKGKEELGKIITFKFN